MSSKAKAEKAPAANLGPRPEAVSVVVFFGSRSLAEAAAASWIEARLSGGLLEFARHVGPEFLESAVVDLRTASLFAGGKLHLLIETGVLETPLAPEELLSQALSGLESGQVSTASSESTRQAALVLLRMLRLLGISWDGEAPDRVIDRIPDSVWGAYRRLSGRSVSSSQEAARSKLRSLLEMALQEGLRGLSENAAGMVFDLVQDGLPRGHWLVLVESRGDLRHPLAMALRARGALVEVGQVELDTKRSGLAGFRPLLERLERESGVVMAPEAAEELLRRTVRFKTEPWSGASALVDPDSLQRLESEYRKLGSLFPSGELRREDVAQWVVDRGEEGAFEWLDALAEGRTEEALERVERRLSGAAEPGGERLRLLSQLAGLVRQVWAVSSVARRVGVPLRPESFGRFRDRIYPRLLEPVPELGSSPLAGSKPFPLYRAFCLACRLPEGLLERLPARLWRSERRLRGESEAPELELASFVAETALWLRSG